MDQVTRRTVEAALFAIVIVVASQRMHSNDLWAYYWASTHAVNDAHAVYSSIPIEAFGRSVPPFIYAPTAILFFLPFAWLAPSAAAWLWLGVSVAAAGITSFGVLPRLMASKGVTPAAATVFTISTFFNYPFYATLLTGQVNIVVGLLLLGFYVLHVRDRAFASGLCLAAAIAIKLYPAIFLILLVRQRRFRDVAFVVIVLLAMGGATLALFPRSLWADWITHTASAGSFGRSLPALAGDLQAYNISLNGTFMRMLGPGALAGWLAIAAGAMMLACSIYYPSGSAPLKATQIAAVALVMFCAAPISWVHHLAMVIPLAALAIPSCGRPQLLATAYAIMCFKWDWASGSMMLIGIAPATIGTGALWVQLLSSQREAS